MRIAYKKEKPPRLSREQRKEALRERIYRRRFLVPNAVTLCNLFFGFTASIYAALGRYDKACVAIGIAILLDGLDGRVARRLNATSEFGVEFDSFSDLVSFGVAPALLVYHWAFYPIADEFGVLVSFLFVLAAAARLARFNIAEGPTNSFQGLPTPAAAAVVAAAVHAFPGIVFDYYLVATACALMTIMALMMVSNIHFFSVKRISIDKPSPLLLLFLGGVIAFIWYNHRIGFLTMSLAYVILGPFPEMSRSVLKKAFGEDTEETLDNDAA